MSEPVATPDPTAPASDPTPAATPPAPIPTDPAPKATKKSLEDSLSTLDAETKAFVLGEVQKARREAGDARTTAKKQAADDARSELAQQIGRAIGLVTDEPPDPAALTEQLTVKTAETRATQAQLAVYKAATALGGDPTALLDSVAFVNSLADVDPTDANAVQTAITAALEANPSLKVAPTRRLPGPNPALGSSANGAPGIDDQIAAAKKAGDTKTWIHLENQKLAAPQPR